MPQNNLKKREMRLSLALRNQRTPQQPTSLILHILVAAALLTVAECSPLCKNANEAIRYRRVAPSPDGLRCCDSYRLEGVDTACHFHFYTKEEAMQCMSGKHVIILGGSFQFGTAMNLMQLLNPAESYPVDPDAWLNCPGCLLDKYPALVSLADMTVDGSGNVLSVQSKKIARLYGLGDGVIPDLDDFISSELEGGPAPGPDGLRVTFANVRYYDDVVPVVRHLLRYVSPDFHLSPMLWLGIRGWWYDFCTLESNSEWCPRDDLKGLPRATVTARANADVATMTQDIVAEVPSIKSVLIGGDEHLPDFNWNIQGIKNALAALPSGHPFTFVRNDGATYAGGVDKSDLDQRNHLNNKAYQMRLSRLLAFACSSGNTGLGQEAEAATDETIQFLTEGCVEDESGVIDNSWANHFYQPCQWTSQMTLPAGLIEDENIPKKEDVEKKDGDLNGEQHENDSYGVNSIGKNSTDFDSASTTTTPASMDVLLPPISYTIPPDWNSEASSILFDIHSSANSLRSNVDEVIFDGPLIWSQFQTVLAVLSGIVILHAFCRSFFLSGCETDTSNWPWPARTYQRWKGYFMRHIRKCDDVIESVISKASWNKKKQTEKMEMSKMDKDVPPINKITKKTPDDGNLQANTNSTTENWIHSKPHIIQKNPEKNKVSTDVEMDSTLETFVPEDILLDSEQRTMPFPSASNKKQKASQTDPSKTENAVIQIPRSEQDSNGKRQKHQGLITTPEVQTISCFSGHSMSSGSLGLRSVSVCETKTKNSSDAGETCYECELLNLDSSFDDSHCRVARDITEDVKESSILGQEVYRDGAGPVDLDEISFFSEVSIQQTICSKKTFSAAADRAREDEDFNNRTPSHLDTTPPCNLKSPTSGSVQTEEVPNKKTALSEQLQSDVLKLLNIPEPGGKRAPAVGFARFVASVHIVAGHIVRKPGQQMIPQWPTNQFGYTWVPWFMMLSGFILSFARLRSRNPDKLEKWYLFTAKRIKSIYPLYLTGLLTMAAIDAFLIRSKFSLGTPLETAASLLLIQAWIPSVTEHVVQPHCWFLSCIIPYWMLHNFMYTKTKRWSTRNIWIILGVLTALPWIFVVAIPAAFGNLDWYKAHEYYGTGTSVDTLVIILKYHPLCYWHTYLSGVLSAHICVRYKDCPPHFLKMGDFWGYTILFTIFGVSPWVQFPAYELSFRLGVLLPLQGMILIGAAYGLSPLAKLFGIPLLSSLGEISYPQYVFQFIAFVFFKDATHAFGFWSLLMALSIVGYAWIQKPLKPWALKRKATYLYASIAMAVIPCVLIGLVAICVGVPDTSAKISDTKIQALPETLEYSATARDTRIDFNAFHSSVGERQLMSRLPPIHPTAPGDAELKYINPSLMYVESLDSFLFSVRRHLFVRHQEQGQFPVPETAEGQSEGHGIAKAKVVTTWYSDIVVGSLGWDDSSAKKKLVPISLRRVSIDQPSCNTTYSYSPVNRTLSVLVRLGPEDPRLLMRETDKRLGITFNHLPMMQLVDEKDHVNAVCTEESVMYSLELSEEELLSWHQMKGDAGAGEDDERSIVQSGVEPLLLWNIDRDPTIKEKNWIGIVHPVEGTFFIRSLYPFLLCRLDADSGVCDDIPAPSNQRMKALYEFGYKIHGGSNVIRLEGRWLQSQINREVNVDGSPFYLAVIHTIDEHGRYFNYFIELEGETPFTVQRVSSPLPLLEAPALDGSVTRPLAFVSGLTIMTGDGNESTRVFVSYGSSNMESRVLELSGDDVEYLFSVGDGFLNAQEPGPSSGTAGNTELCSNGELCIDDSVCVSETVCVSCASPQFENKCMTWGRMFLSEAEDACGKKCLIDDEVVVTTVSPMSRTAPTDVQPTSSTIQSDFDKVEFKEWPQSPPDNLRPDQVPMFVSVGFDDNSIAGFHDDVSGTGGMVWAADFFRSLKNPGGSNPGTFDGMPARVSFFHNTVYIEKWKRGSPSVVKRSWRAAYEDGHEVGTHMHRHFDGSEMNQDQWEEGIVVSRQWLSKAYNPSESNGNPDPSYGVGIPASEIEGFRAPFLSYNAEMFTAVLDTGLVYDCSIEEGWQRDQNGTNFAWPYTLDNGSDGNKYALENGFPGRVPLGTYPGLWEVPVHAVIIPPDSVADQYGFSPGLRDRVKSKLSWFETSNGKMTGFDYNLWVIAKLTKAEFSATLKYTLDLRLQGNRAPFTFGAHTDYYSSEWPKDPELEVGARERQEAIEEFIQYALSKQEVRIVPFRSIVDWIRNPDREIL